MLRNNVSFSGGSSAGYVILPMRKVSRKHVLPVKVGVKLDDYLKPMAKNRIKIRDITTVPFCAICTFNADCEI